MIKKMAWDTFKNTGDINTFLEYKQIEDIEKNIIQLGPIDEITQIQEIANIDVEQNGKI